MKVNDIINEGVLSSIGRGLGNMATGAVRALDRAAGGTGVVGTSSQQAAYLSKQEKQAQAHVNKALANLGQRAMTEFTNMLRNNKFDIQRLDELDPAVQDQMKKYLQSWVFHFFGDHNNPSIGNLIKTNLATLSVPAALNAGSIQDYMNDAADIRKDVEANTLSYALAQQAAATSGNTAPAGSSLAPGVTVVHAGDPIILRYNNRDFARTDTDQWVYLGSNRTPSPEMVKFLDKQLQHL